ncbi:porin family protein [Flavobacterium johnsoniae]|uniref:Outer membrane protein beta-barrel domain-containing protein n=1 Tax=Flavobacterium johnsoniae TaxID=986 RepID=A0A1J7CWN1_FLAJO|nr:porin family protein [Flavobacterium johnsoniae]OIV43994.1 hypothetical protein BKM63_02000 [Flavobacterium johnsoniae]
MKKIILAAIAIMLFEFVSAQETRFGIKGGANLSSWTGDTNNVNLNPKFGFVIGGFSEIKLTDKFALQPELNYSTQGTKLDNFVFLQNLHFDDFELPTADIKWNLAYLNIPVMFKYYIVNKFNIEAGPQIGILLSAKTKTKIEGINQTSEMDVKDFFKSIDFGLNFGASYDFTENVSIGARYNLGLSNIAKTIDGDKSKLHNSVLALSLAYKF